MGIIVWQEEKGTKESGIRILKGHWLKYVIFVPENKKCFAIQVD